MWTIKTMQNELIYKTETYSDLENKLMVTGEGCGAGIDWEFRMDVYILLYLNGINKLLLCCL